jgi:hypothetical protein
MMKKLLCFSLLIALSGCVDREPSSSNVEWMNDCDRHFSYDSREKNACKERVKNHEAIDSHTGTVLVNPENAVNDTEIQTHKSRD